MQDTQASDVVGQWVVVKHLDEKGNGFSTMEWQPGPLQLCMIHGWVYNADEIDRAPTGVNTVYQAVLDGKALFTPSAPDSHRTIYPHEDFRFVATGNTNGGGDHEGLHPATMQQDAATVERFPIVAEFKYHEPAAEVKIIMGTTLANKSDAEGIVDFANRIRDRHPADFDLTLGQRVLINIATIGIGRASMVKGVQYAFANRLPPDQRKAAMDVAKRIFRE